MNVPLQTTQANFSIIPITHELFYQFYVKTLPSFSQGFIFKLLKGNGPKVKLF